MAEEYSCQTLDDHVAGEITGDITSEFLNDLRTIRRKSILSGNVRDFKNYFLLRGVLAGPIIEKINDNLAVPMASMASLSGLIICSATAGALGSNIYEHLQGRRYHWYRIPGRVLGATGGAALGYAAAEYLSRLIQ